MKVKELRKMDKSNRDKKLKDLKMELVKASASKENTSKPRQIRKAIARIHTLNAVDKGVLSK